MAKKATKKVEATPAEETVSILLNVPKSTYFSVKGKADTKTMKTNVKKTIHDEMVEMLVIQDKKK